MNKIDEILSHYGSESPGVLSNMYRLFNHGKLAGSGKLVILPVDQGWEHGPGRSFAVNPAGYDPEYHFKLALDAGLSGHAAPLGSLEIGARKYAGQLPLILKLNNHDVLHSEKDPHGAQTAGVQDAIRLGCIGIGYTIYPGSVLRRKMYEQLRKIALEAKSAGLLVFVWSYPRGTELSKEGETALDVVAYAAQIAAQLGAHIIKVKLPSDHLEIEKAREVYEEFKIPRKTQADRVKHIMQSAFAGKRVVIFSGGAIKNDEESLFNSIKAIKDGGGFGSIIGRNSFQRTKPEAIKMLSKIISIYTS